MYNSFSNSSSPFLLIFRLVFSHGHSSPRIYGGCFGCQIIAHALGGTVDYNPDNKFFLKAETIRVFPETFEATFSNDEEKQFLQSEYKIIVSHGDCVCKLPAGATRLASSDTCLNEMYTCGIQDCILACQSHPEFDYKYAVEERIWPAVVDRKQRLSDDQIADSVKSFENFSSADSDKLISLISSFLHRP